MVKVNDDNTIKTASGNLILDSNGGLVDINDNLDVSGNLNVAGDLDIDGDTELDSLNVDGNTTLNDTTIDGTLDLNGDLVFGDGDKLKFGDSGDLEIVHDGTNSVIQDVGQGSLVIKSNGGGQGTAMVFAAGSTGQIQMRAYGTAGVPGTAGVQLFYGGSTSIADNSTGRRLSTTTYGVEINGQLNVTGDIVAFTGSDERLKLNITPIDDSLAKVNSISGNTYDWNENSDREGSDTGVIAQEVEKLGLPGVVTTRENGYKAVRYEKLVPLLIEAIKELSDKVSALEDKLNN